MTNTSLLSTSVEAARLRRQEEGEDFFYSSTKAEWHQVTVSQALEWSPVMSAHWLGSDKFVVAIIEGERSFAEAFHLEKEKAFSHVEQLTPQVLYVRCVPPTEHRAQPENYVLELVALAFMPF